MNEGKKELLQIKLIKNKYEIQTNVIMARNVHNLLTQNAAQNQQRGEKK